jgi:hypothetical protein
MKLNRRYNLLVIYDTQSDVINGVKYVWLYELYKYYVTFWKYTNN